MCGICGYIGPEKVGDEQLWKMNDTMRHRGPDDGGVWQGRLGEDYIGLAHRRLSILDLSKLGHQPMMTGDEKYLIVYNGEVYNFNEIRHELERSGVSFQSNCDTEVVLQAYVKWGEACFSKFNGMFAVAIADLSAQSLVLARDRMGVKPLYFYHEEGHFVFASELKPIMNYPFFRKWIARERIGDFLCNKYLASPLCIFEHTYKLRPGSVLRYEGGIVEQYMYWDLLEQYRTNRQNRIETFQEALSLTENIITDAVRARMIADVPVGTFLSGGFDSTLITAVAQSCAGKPVSTYSIGFYDKERNEAPYAAEIAKYLGTDHHEHYVEEADILELLKDMPVYYDEPFSDSSQLPTMLVSRYSAEDISVALSGDGGDEIFCGYNMYDWTKVAQCADPLGAIAYHIPGMGKLKNAFSPELRAFINNRDQTSKTQLFMDVMIEEAEKLLGMPCRKVKHTWESVLDMKNWQERRMLLDMETYLPDEVMAKTDRASMKYSLEVRSPLLDHRLVEASFRIPHKYKYHQCTKKYMIKQLTYQYVPKKLLDRPKKGFGVPMKRWLRTVLKQEVQKYANPMILRRQDIFNPKAAVDLIEKQEKSDKVMYSSMLWSFYVFQRWYQTYIEDLW